MKSIALTSDPGGDMQEMFERDQQRRREAEAVRKHVLASFPEAPPSLAVLMAEEPWLAQWLATLAPKGN